jgi:AAHS family benzoate transporter-like MFS transporter
MIPKPQPEVPVAAVDLDPNDATVSAR